VITAQYNLASQVKDYCLVHHLFCLRKIQLLPEIDRVSVDVWNYKDDFLQPMQLKNRDTEEKRSYTAVYDWQNNSVVQLRK
jgi:hypothetical protein